MTFFKPDPLRRLLALALSGLFFMQGLAAQQTQRIFFVGNSLTDAMNYQGLQSLAESRGNVDTWSRLMIPGAPLSTLWDSRTTGGFVGQPYGNPDNAFAVYNWDILSLQPFDRQIEGTSGDRAMVANFYNLIKSKSPNCKVFIYAHWPRTPGGISQTVATKAQYNDIWTSPTNIEARKFFEDLTTAVRSDYPATAGNFRMVPLGEVFYSLNNNQSFLDAAGIESIWGVYSDGIHMKGIGSYIVSCVMYAMAYHDDPAGLGVPGVYGNIPAASLPYIHQTVKDVIISKSSYTGISFFGPVPVQSVRLSAPSMQLNVTKTATLVPVFTPSNAANKTVSWNSSNAAIASVTTNGVVTANSAGSANITVSTADGGFESVCAVNVVNTGTAVTGIAVNKPDTSILVDANETLVASISPANATNKDVVWASSDSSVATVSTSGLVTAIKKGVVAITATSVNGLFSASTTVTVTRLNNRPVAVMKYSPGNFGYAPYKVTFDGRSSSDPDPEDFVIGYDWIVKQRGASTNLRTEVSNSFDYTFTSAGVFDVTLQAVDNAENLRSLNTELATITVLTMPEVAAAETALCYEGFDYVKAPITDFNGGRGWRRGWEVQSPATTTVDEFAVNNVSPLMVSNLRQVGNYMILGQGYSQSGRMFDTASNGAFKNYLTSANSGTIGKSGTTLWFSSVIRPQNNNKKCGVSLVDSGIGWYSNHAGKKVEFGGFGGSNWGFAFGHDTSQVQHLSTVPIVNDVPVLLVAKIEFGPTNTVALYVNPTPGSAPTGTPIVANTNSAINFNSLGTSFGSGSNRMGLDEIRFGANYADVAPFSDTASSSLSNFRDANGLASDGSEDLLTPAGDGIGNLLKYAFNMIGNDPGQKPALTDPNPSVLTPDGSAGLPRVGMGSSAEGGRVQITYIRRKSTSSPGITYTVLFSETLEDGSWAVDASASETTEPIGNDNVLERVTVTASPSGSAKQFTRVRISVPG